MAYTKTAVDFTNFEWDMAIRRVTVKKPPGTDPQCQLHGTAEQYFGSERGELEDGWREV